MEVYDFGLRIKELRKKKHLSQDDAAKKLGITRSSISAYERNTKMPRLEVLVKMTVLYNSSLDYIMGLSDRTNLFLDDLTESQQDTILEVVERIIKELKNNKT